MIAQTTTQRTLTIAGHTHPVTVWARAIARARAEGIKVHRIGSQWYATSASHPGQLHSVNGHCDCQGAQHGHVCTHLAATLSARLGQGELARCATCGHIAARSEMASEYRHVGGQPDRREWYCANGHQVAEPEPRARLSREQW